VLHSRSASVPSGRFSPVLPPHQRNIQEGARTPTTAPPWATGTSHVAATDNDLFHIASIEMGLYRSNAFGDRGQGMLADASGAGWHSSWAFHVAINRRDEIVNLRDRSVLRRR
jgi:hypothetical protein